MREEGGEEMGTEEPEGLDSDHGPGWHGPLCPSRPSGPVSGGHLPPPRTGLHEGGTACRASSLLPARGVRHILVEPPAGHLPVVLGEGVAAPQTDRLFQQTAVFTRFGAKKKKEKKPRRLIQRGQQRATEARAPPIQPAQPRCERSCVPGPEA